jgi:hypothetical protein
MADGDRVNSAAIHLYEKHMASSMQKPQISTPPFATTDEGLGRLQ